VNGRQLQADQLDKASTREGLVPVIRLFNLPALNQSFVYALECRQTGNAFVKYSDYQEPEAAMGKCFPEAVVRRAEFSIALIRLEKSVCCVGQ
jgi:hypothetical protein